MVLKESLVGNWGSSYTVDQLFKFSKYIILLKSKGAAMFVLEYSGTVPDEMNCMNTTVLVGVEQILDDNLITLKSQKELYQSNETIHNLVFQGSDYTTERTHVEALFQDVIKDCTLSGYPVSIGESKGLRPNGFNMM